MIWGLNVSQTIKICLYLSAVSSETKWVKKCGYSSEEKNTFLWDNLKSVIAESVFVIEIRFMGL